MRIPFWLISLVLLVPGYGPGTAAPSSLTQIKSQTDTRVIDSLPAPNDDVIRQIRAADEWHNPFIMVHRDGYELVLHNQPRSPQSLTLEELEQSLLQLPFERWPLGKVIAASESGLRSPGDEAKIAANLKALKRMVKLHKLRIDQWPSA